MKPKPQPTFSWDEVDRLVGTENLTDQAPADAFTVGEYADHYHINPRTASSQLARLVAIGKLDRSKARRQATDGSMRACFAYWPKDGS